MSLGCLDHSFLPFSIDTYCLHNLIQYHGFKHHLGVNNSNFNHCHSSLSWTPDSYIQCLFSIFTQISERHLKFHMPKHELLIPLPPQNLQLSLTFILINGISTISVVYATKFSVIIGSTPSFTPHIQSINKSHKLYLQYIFLTNYLILLTP